MSIALGKYSYINEPYSTGYYNDVTIQGTNKKPSITIGRYTSIGKNLQFCLTHHNYKAVSTFPEFFGTFSRGNIDIGNDVWIGMNATIMDNVRIGNGAVIGAASVVSKDVPDYAIVVGNPARITKYRFSDDVIKRLKAAAWWDLEKDELYKLGINTKSLEEFLTSLELYKSTK